MNDCLLALSCLSALKILSLKEIAFERFLHATPVFFVFNRPPRPVHTINSALSAHQWPAEKRIPLSSNSAYELELLSLDEIKFFC
jgi:hypothetical protein